ncbi:MBL fold metallo-hydrolase [Candidatus Saganbacteria bacterium]|nr:MBL fold metallo-hydrolase [Candidatus Saganbacteria bacterium]
MNIKTIKVGELRTNCYIVSDDKEALVIDPGFEIEKIAPEIAGLKVKAIVLTHGHYDHVTEAFGLGAPIWIGEKDEFMLLHSTGKKADRPLKDGEMLQGFKIILTPGHTPGGICLYNEKEKVIFTGDTLFAGDHGRTDLPGGSESEILSSLKKLLDLPPETRVYPGHGRPTTIGDEQNLLQ